MVKNGDVVNKIISRNVARLREERGWSQEDLAEKYGCTYQYISQMETGSRGFGKNTFRKLMRAFGVSEKELLEMPEELTSKEVGEAWKKFQIIKTSQAAELFDRVMDLLSQGDAGALKTLDGIVTVLENGLKKESGP